ncbi:unnamed protein product [Paramecium primaurelia]|uniref:Uncharacterized protein n=1 Tax=Paramecium primaurelia TaxID=5886 RepID=A0A8S1L6S3_PARPR|nr:unnamed protein product [Paramecium primaurelia]
MKNQIFLFDLKADNIYLKMLRHFFPIQDKSLLETVKLISIYLIIQSKEFRQHNLLNQKFMNNQNNRTPQTDRNITQFIAKIHPICQPQSVSPISMIQLQTDKIQQPKKFSELHLIYFYFIDEFNLQYINQFYDIIKKPLQVVSIQGKQIENEIIIIRINDQQIVN